MSEKKRSCFIPPNIIGVDSPTGMNVIVEQYCDSGANVMEAFRDDLPQQNGYMGSVFKGYESTGREPFTLQDIVDFMKSLLGHKKFKQNAPIVIKIVGEVDGYESPHKH